MRLLRPGSVRFALLILFAASPLAAADTMTSFDVARLRNVSSVALSPDGSRVAYTLSVPRRTLEEEDGAAWAELHVVGRDGVSRPFVTGAVNVADIAWTKDGREISFLAKRGKDEQRCLYAISADGGEARRLLCHEADITSYSFGPDGKRVAYLASAAVSKKEKDFEKKGFNQQVYEESARAVRIWVANLEGNAKPKALEVNGSASELHWSPAGPLLAVALAPTSLVDDGYMNRRVTILDADSGKAVARAENPGKLGGVAWSPDGKNVAYTAGADANDPSAGRLMMIAASGGAARELLRGYEGNVGHIAWPDSDRVMFVGAEGVQTILGEAPREDRSGRPNRRAMGPVIATFDVSRDGKTVAMVAQTPSHPSEVFLWPLSERAPRRLTNSNAWLSAMRLAPQEVVKFKARDGLELEGLLIHPLEEKRGERYPLILTVHGGPEGHYQDGWLTSYSDTGQLAAGRGFAVFYPNYRGSTGRGVAFSKMGQGDPAGKEFDDLVDAVDHLVASGLVDKAKVGVTGGSYGGYATAWCATRYSDRFAAGVMFVGISDLVSKAGTTDIPNEEFLVHALRWPWEDWKLMIERSPLSHAGEARTPLLILDGKDDPRVHPSQSLAFYRYVKVRGKAPVRLVLYPGEGHGNRLAAHRLDYNLRMIQWMEHYLKGPGGAPPPYEIDYEAR